MMKKRFVAREPTQKEQSRTIEYKRFSFLKNAAIEAVTRNGSDLRLAIALGYEALSVFDSFHGWFNAFRSLLRKVDLFSLLKIGMLSVLNAAFPFLI